MKKHFPVLRASRPEEPSRGGGPSMGEGRAWEITFDTPVFDEKIQAIEPSPDSVATAVLSADSIATEQFRLLRARVEAIGQARPFRCVGIVSASGGEGKSTVSLGLSKALSQEGRRVLLVEADVRKPAIEGYLGLPRAAGLGEYLEGTERSARLRRVGGFYFLSAGSAAQSHEQLGTDRMGDLLQVARRHFHFVVVDCPPVMPVADSVIMQDFLDGFLFVVRARHSPRETLEQALSRLKADKVQGLVFNDHKEILPGYYTYAYRRYGEHR